MDDAFVHLRVHSHHSMMWGASSVKELCRAARDSGVEELGLIDSNGSCGFIDSIEVAGECGVKAMKGSLEVVYQTGYIQK
jgi:DNA polymerase III alpha subunit